MRKLWIAIAVAVVVVGLGLAVAVWNLDAYVNANREAIASRVEETLGRQVSFGEVGIGFRGGLGVRVEELRIGDDPAFSQEDFLRADGVDVRIAILPALFGRIEVARVVLRDPEITVIQTASGLSTDSLGGGAAAPAGEEPAPEAPPPAVLVALVDIRGGTLRFIDRTTKPAGELAVQQLDFTASDLSPDEPVDFELSAAVLGAEAVNLRASGRVGPVASDDPTVDLSLRLDPLDLDAARRVPGMAEAIPPDLDAKGPLRVEAAAKGTLAKLAFEAQLDAGGAELRYGEGFSKARGTPFSLELRGTRSGDDIALDPAELVLDDSRLTARATVSAGDVPRVDFSVGSDSLRLASVGAAAADAPDVVRGLAVEGKLSLPPAGPKGDVSLRSSGGTVAGTSFDGLEVDLRLDGSRIVARKLALRALGSSLSGSAAFQGGALPRVEFDLSADALSLAALGAAEPDAPDELRGLSLSGRLSLPDSGPKGSVSLRSASGTVSGASYQDLTGDVTLDGPRTELRKLSLRSFDGSVDASGTHDRSDAERPRFDGRMRLAGVSLPALLRVYAPAQAGRIEGTLAANLALRGAGGDWEQIKPTLSGDGTVTLRDGLVRDFNPAGQTLQELARLPVLAGSRLGRVAEAHPEVFGVGDTAFENVDGRLEIRDGWIEARDFRFAARDYALVGAGRFSLDGEVDLGTTLVFSSGLSGELVAAANPLRYLRTPEGRVAFPVRVRGSTQRLAVVPDLNAVAQAAGREAVTDLLTKKLAPKRAPEGEAAPEGQAAPEQGAPQAPTAEDLGRELIRRGLGGLLGGQRD